MLLGHCTNCKEIAIAWGYSSKAPTYAKLGFPETMYRNGRMSTIWYNKDRTHILEPFVHRFISARAGMLSSIDFEFWTNNLVRCQFIALQASWHLQQLQCQLHRFNQQVSLYQLLLAEFIFKLWEPNFFCRVLTWTVGSTMWNSISRLHAQKNVYGYGLLCAVDGRC